MTAAWTDVLLADDFLHPCSAVDEALELLPRRSNRRFESSVDVAQASLEVGAVARPRPGFVKKPGLGQIYEID